MAWETRYRLAGARMVIASLVFDVLPDKRAEFVSAVGGWLRRWLRAAQGCLGCRLAADFENQNVFVMTSEWDGKPFLDQYLVVATSRSSREPASFTGRALTFD